MVKAKLTRVDIMNENGMISRSLDVFSATIMVKDGKTYLYAFYTSYPETVEEIYLLKGFKAVTWAMYRLAVICDGFEKEKPVDALLQAADRLCRVAYSED
jgi:hypothetical protein